MSFLDGLEGRDRFSAILEKLKKIAFDGKQWEEEESLEILDKEKIFIIKYLEENENDHQLGIFTPSEHIYVASVQEKLSKFDTIHHFRYMVKMGEMDKIGLLKFKEIFSQITEEKYV